MAALKITRKTYSNHHHRHFQRESGLVSFLSFPFFHLFQPMDKRHSWHPTSVKSTEWNILWHV